jgi:DNA-binding MarR family transcriptional regulator
MHSGPILSLVPPPDSRQLDLGLGLERRIASLWWALMREVPSDLSRTAASVLARLKGEGPLRVTTLAASEHVAQPSMSMLVQRLVDRGLVDRLEDPEDRRASRIAITELGKLLLDERAQARSSWLRERLTRLEADERDTLAHALVLLDRLLDDLT